MGSSFTEDQPRHLFRSWITGPREAKLFNLDGPKIWWSLLGHPLRPQRHLLLQCLICPAGPRSFNNRLTVYYPLDHLQMLQNGFTSVSNRL
ncbi:unnamed protein product [Microthlaspi erraticum]|uniref:Uncharacterized protein n=1 Tax=Microthlaspi erraticum TaxID=1685480 RepID=A0A6D2J918_9BRAS|nr:unnamed protein product [Microthlaspi erraticum]